MIGVDAIVGGPTDRKLDDAVTIRATSAGVDVVVERGGAMWTGVHARRAQLTPDEAEQVAGRLLAAAAAARREDGAQ